MSPSGSPQRRSVGASVRQSSMHGPPATRKESSPRPTSSRRSPSRGSARPDGRQRPPRRAPWFPTPVLAGPVPAGLDRRRNRDGAAPALNSPGRQSRQMARLTVLQVGDDREDPAIVILPFPKGELQ